MKAKDATKIPSIPANDALDKLDDIDDLYCDHRNILELDLEYIKGISELIDIQSSQPTYYQELDIDETDRKYLHQQIVTRQRIMQEKRRKRFEDEYISELKMADKMRPFQGILQERRGIYHDQLESLFLMKQMKRKELSRQYRLGQKMLDKLIEIDNEYRAILKKIEEQKQTLNQMFFENAQYDCDAMELNSCFGRKKKKKE